jgi:hypothetical protein
MTKNFLHSGGIGDIIWSLPTVIKICRLSNCKAKLFIKAKNRWNTGAHQFNMLKRLLLTQPYIDDVIEYPLTDFFQYVMEPTIDFDLDKFRASGMCQREHLVLTHLRVFGLPFDNWATPWLDTSNINIDKPSEKYCLINWTGRVPDQTLDWKRVWNEEVLSRFSRDQVYFIGLDTELAEFEKMVGEKLKHLKTTDMYDVAAYIKNADACFCNQSSFHSLCVSMGKEFWLELSDRWGATCFTGTTNEHILTNRRLPMSSEINKYEKKITSQNGEDGIIQYILSKIGTTNKFCVEFGIHAHEGNTVHLRKSGWNCLWMDGGGDGNIVKRERINAENINELFAKYSVPKEFDILSIDIDSNDYYVWKAITGYNPRMVIIEYNAKIPITESLSVAYDPNGVWKGDDYMGASLLAMFNLGKKKGYTLVACDTSGTNAFFVRNDLVPGNFEVKGIEELYCPPNYGEIVNGRHIGHRDSGRKMVKVED